jgi:uncharacterized membrane protein
VEFSQETLIAVGFYIINWFFYLWLMDYSPWRKKTLSYLVAQKRIEWLEATAQRSNRIVDSTMLMGQMNGSLFYASSALLALGACFALLTNREHITDLLFATLHQIDTTETYIEVKIISLMLIFAYCFFKFGWAFRLFTYSSVLIGSIPNPQKDASEEYNQKIQKSCMQAAHINIQAARHFDRGQRAIFASLPLLSWFAGNKIMMVTSVIIVLAMLRRQFLSQSVYILK